ncbi:17971_t:CDS:10 [Funneliformis caledonium]|uniref:17971_t:CDS:1 n=1 Tax=Funneliformis caledonium TaxID=1117310 RepID=A0A9N8V4X1_9GLOM|nr:17971_t:CDS:10 [Funneliformis caledonium]
MNDEAEKAPEKIPELICDSPDYPELKARWFHAVDFPIFDPLSNTQQDEDKYPIEWIPFSKRDSNALENAFKAGKIKEKIPVNEDFLFEVDIEDREIMPVYWSGPIYTVTRATWFFQNELGKIIPCDENLALQLEKGYIDQEAWVPQVEIIGPDGSIKVIPRPDKKYNLTGRLASQYVIYATPTTAWMIKDDLTGQLSKSIFSTFSGGVNLGGLRLFRGYNEVEKFTSKKPNLDKINDCYDEDTPEARKRTLEKKRQLQETEDFCVDASDEIREIDHLILVIHGVGQKLSERSGYTNFVHEVNVFRKTLKRTYSANPPQECIARLPPNYEKKKDSQVGNGIQFGVASEDDDMQDLEGECTLDDMTLDGVPGLRMFMSDVLMDVLLYMTPNYREQMLRTVTKEVNRVYNLFLERNPKFKEKGKVSIFGHSLGSLLAFDVLCHQPPLFNSSNAIFGIFDERSQHKVNGNDESEVKNYEEIVKLDFPVWNFFAAGSPIGLFLMLKGLKVGSRKYLVNPKNGDESNEVDHKKFKASTSIPYCYPAVKNIYNIFHRTDPIAYRLEPLVSRRIASLGPALIPYNKGGLKGVTLGISKKTTNLFSAVKASLLFTKKSKASNSSSSATNSRSGSMDISRKSLDSTSEQRKQSSIGNSKVNDGSDMPSFEDLSGPDKLTSLNSTGRIDYCLQEGILDIAYFTAITVHLNYWYDHDVAYFILREVYGNIYDDGNDA